MPTITCPECKNSKPVNDSTYLKMVDKSVKCHDCQTTFIVRREAVEMLAEMVPPALPPRMAREAEPVMGHVGVEIAPEPRPKTVKQRVEFVNRQKATALVRTLREDGITAMLVYLFPAILVSLYFGYVFVQGGDGLEVRLIPPIISLAISVVVGFIIKRQFERQSEMMSLALSQERLLLQLVNDLREEK